MKQFKATGKAAGIVWDPAENKPLACFKGGIAIVGEAAAKKLKAMGYKAEEIKEAGEDEVGKKE